MNSTSLLLSVPKSSGDKNLDAIMNPAGTSYYKVKVDQKAQEILGEPTDTYCSSGEFSVQIFERSKPMEVQEFLKAHNLREIRYPTGVDCVWAFLSFLANGATWIMKIPEGEEEVNIVLGFAVLDGQEYIVYLEHEYEDHAGVTKVHEIHLHARPRAGFREKGAVRLCIPLGAIISQ